ncbi:bifunctional UDP-sugar hydrolase/5'-nucleotidase [uncultured Draconibacterium sp.]|uniref:bifunctional metallophosphatase/5'-nucleotidase n=1 Tax=uncultured Draconibacterium sp. TaxID=1573823 RepID=UPI0032166BEA
MKTIGILILACLVLIYGCGKENTNVPSESQHLTIFCVNDVHGQIDNLSKVKYIVDKERTTSNVLVVSAGDLFSGNPVVDNYSKKGFPIIDAMNKIGFDISALGNHDFDYGPEVLKSRIEDSAFPWICANAVPKRSYLHEFEAFTTIHTGDLTVSFLALLETNGSNTDIIPSSHPWRVADYSFTPALNMIDNFSSLKSSENADLLIALSHLGSYYDFQLAREHPFFDLVIGGHNHSKIDTMFHSTPVVQSGGYLHFLGKLELKIKDKSLQSSNFTLIDLDNYSEFDSDLAALISEYNNLPELDEEIGYSEADHGIQATGCFYTHALKEYMNADVSFQNTGGVRATLPKGVITKRQIYEISPFNNGTVFYNMTVEEIKNFLIGSGSGFYYTGIHIQKSGGQVIIKDTLDRIIPDDYVLKVGINDYIPAVHSLYFPENGEKQTLTAAETLVAYLQTVNTPIDFSSCYNYFRY